LADDVSVSVMTYFVTSWDVKPEGSNPIGSISCGFVVQQFFGTNFTWPEVVDLLRRHFHLSYNLWTRSTTNRTGGVRA